MDVCVLSGGRSPERDISLRSGKACANALRTLGHTVRELDFKGGQEIKELLRQPPEVAFVVLHGSLGEDGCVQGLLEWCDIPYTGSGPAASALCMDKWLSKLMFKSAQLPVASGLLNPLGANFKDLCERWSCTELFKKPRNGGSSVDTGPLKNQHDMDAVDFSKESYLLEPAIKGREFTLSFLQEKSGWRQLPILELRPTQGDFYDLHCKYTPGGTQFILPAELDLAQSTHMQSLGERALNACGVRGYARVDMLLNEQGPVIMEINTLPGMTETSDLPAQAKAAGISFEELTQFILNSALSSF